MKNLFNKITALVIAMMVCLMPITSFAGNKQEDNLDKDNAYQISSKLVNAGIGDGFKKNKRIKAKDPHYGWELGNFYVSNYTETEKKDGHVVFIKNVGDKVTLWFDLEQDIEKLNGNEALSIKDDENNCDQRIGTEKADFGHGALFVRHINSNNKGKIKPYYDFLKASASKDADTKVRTFEEGDYEVVLDYSIKKTNINIKDVNTAPTYTNYRTSFKFSVRNGNCMSYPIDLSGKGELANNGYASKGFRIDFAQSKTIKVKVKRDIDSGKNSLDTRFSKPAKDGDEFTEPGIYTITTKNRLTKDKTVKTIYVGNKYYNRADPSEHQSDSMGDPEVLQQVEENVYNDLIGELNSEEYFIENVSTQYYSQEYLDEIAYNSQTNMYFGYTLSELEELYKGKKYVFTLGDNGQTVVTQFKRGDIFVECRNLIDKAMSEYAQEDDTGVLA